MDTSNFTTSLANLNYALEQLRSSKASERRKGLESLRDLMTDDEALCKLLDSNTLRYNPKDESLSKLRTWDIVFQTVTNFFEQTHAVASRGVAITCIQTLVKMANSCGPFLSYDPLYKFILKNLNDEKTLESYSFGFMQLLQNLLSVNLYAASFKGNHWRHIILTLIKLYKSQNIPKTMILETLNVSIIHGSSIPGVISTLRNEVVQFYRVIYLEEQNRNLLPTVLINRGIVLLCQYNAIEFRGILCKLGETIIPTILSHMGGSVRDHNEEVSIVDLLLVQMQLHTPCDIGTNSPAFHAEDREIWDDILDRIYSFTIDMIDEIAKKSGYTKNVTIPTNLLYLAVKATKLIHDQKTDDSNTSDGFPPNKRFMVHKSFQAIVGDTTHYQPSETQIVWIQYISAVLNAFPEISDYNMLYRLHRMGVSLLNSTFIVREEVYSFLQSILFAEKYLKQKGQMDKPNTWGHVWDIVIKSLQVNEAKPEALEFIRRLLIEVRSSNINSLLLLFIENAIGPSRDSLHLFSEFLTRCTIPEYVKVSPTTRTSISGEGTDKSCPRVALMKWIVTMLMDKCVPNCEIQIATILCSLLVNRSHLFVQTAYLLENAFQITQPFRICFEDFEATILNCCFVSPPEVIVPKARNPKKIEDRGMFSVIGIITETLFSSLQEDLQQLPPIDVHSKDFTKKLMQLQYRVSVLLNITNLLEVHKLGEESQEFKLNMMDLFDKAFHRYGNIISEFLNRSEITMIQSHSVVKTMRELLMSDHLCDKIKLNLARKYPSKILEFWKNTFWRGLPTKKVVPLTRNANQGSPMKEFHSFRHQEEFEGEIAISEKRAIELASVESLKCLIEFSYISELKFQILNGLIDDCIELGITFHPIIQFYLDLCIEMLLKLIPPFAELRGCHDKIMNLVQMLCRTYHGDVNCAVKIWELFYKLAPTIGAEPQNTIQRLFMPLVGGMISKIETSGAIDVFKIAFRSLSVLAKSDPLTQWTLAKVKSDPNLKQVFPWVAYLLKSSSQQVRLAAVKFFCDVFEAEHISPKVGLENRLSEAEISQASIRRKDLFELVYKTLLEVYAVPASTEEEMLEESINRTSIVITCLVKTIFVYPFNQKRVLFCLFLMIKLKSISIGLTSRALRNENPTATKTLVSHILYTLEKWLKLDYDILEFPYQLFDCSSPEEFCMLYKREISFQLFQCSDHDNLHRLDNFSKLIAIPVLNLIQGCYGMIMSRLILGLATGAEEEERPGSIKRNEMMNNLNTAYNRLIQIFGNVVNAEEHLKICLKDVVLNTISLTFESTITTAWDCGSVHIPEPEPPVYDERKIRVGLEQLRYKLHYYENVSVVGYLVRNSPRELYKILLTLVLRIHDSHDALEKFWRLHHFAFFVKLLLSEPRDIFELMKPYTCQFIVYSYLRLLSLKNPDPAFTIAVLHNLIEFVKALTTLSVDEMSLHFRPIISQIITTVNALPESTYLATRLLDFLLKTSGASFKKCIPLLDPFPSEIEAFTEYKDIHSEFKYGRQRNEWTLEKELQNCLVQMTTSQSHGACTKERLRFIKQLLSQRKFDLEVLVKVMAGNKFSDDCSKDIIHNLIQMLLGVIIRSRDEEIMLEACRCLGEIGSIDLAVLVLPSYDPKSKLQSATSAILSLIISAAEFLLSEDIQLVATTGDVFESLFQTTECSEIFTTELTKINPRLAQVLLPFKSGDNETPVVGTVASCNPSVLESKLTQLEVTETITYASWITQLTCGLIAVMRPEGSLLERLLPLCRLKVTFCEEVLPFVIYICLTASRNNPIVRKLLSSYFRKFFSNFATVRQSSSQPLRWEVTNSEEGENVSIHANKLALRCLLRVIQYLRLHKINFDIGSSWKTPWDNNYWLDVNYLDLAKAAQFCGAYLSSILYSEIHAYSMKDDRVEPLVQGFSYDVCAFPRGQQSPNLEIEKLLLKAYISIGESDAVYGCGSARYSDFPSNIQHLQQMNQWNRSLAAYDSYTPNDRIVSQTGTCTSLKELGLFSTLWTYLKGAELMSGFIEPDLSEIQYECGWRLSKWDINCDKANYLKEESGIEELSCVPTVQKCIYESIQSSLNNDRLSHKESIRRGFMSIMQDLKHASLESAENLHTFLTQFQMFRIIEDFYSTRVSGVPIDPLLQNWQLLDKLGCSNLKFQEPVLYLRSVLLKAFNDKQNSQTLINSYNECVLNLLSKARTEGRLELAENCTSKIFSRSMLPRKELETARNHWARGEQDIALSILGRFVTKNGPDRNGDIHATSLLLFGEWLSETKSENPTVIMDTYFVQSAKLYESKKAFGTAEEISKAYITLAKYADSLYQNVSSYLKSEMFQEKMRTLVKSKEELEQMKQANSTDKDAMKSIAILQQQIKLDSQEASVTAGESKKFLLVALKYYLRGLKYSSQYDLLIFRVIGLWLDNTNITDTMKVMSEESLPSYKYVIVLHQLSARLGLNANNGVAEALQRILLNCAKDHPYHTIPVLLAQALMHKDKETIPGMNKKQVENDRVVAARHLVDTLKKGPLGELTMKMEHVWNALINLANVQEASKENVKRNIPETAPLRKLRSLSIVPIPTISLDVSPSLKYKDYVIGISSFQMEYALVGGINSPKLISCTGTNGMKYNMLLKGQDDLRQDAVMQQVFAVMNKLLQAEPITKARRLQIRTYKVVPLSQRTGIIEWCENTQTFGGYLVGSPSAVGAHRLYRPNDYSPQECRKKLVEVKDGTSLKKWEVYSDIISKFKPVFRNFFFENFKDPGTFFERRLAYTRSVATSSMVGYILGLGDRHVLNILVDKNTAEFIHIDLGVAFEQGRILPTPELVPFRLSRDVVDGMGFCGVEGDFRRSCEMTLEVLRNNAEIILTILEVLLYDPLYIWTLSADRVQKVQPGGRKAGRPSVGNGGNTQIEETQPKERNNSAARVLLRLKQKLIGVEEGVSSGSTLSVPGHVSLLIQRACDQSRLSRLFPGWQPYL